jgi:hypothetical protein
MTGQELLDRYYSQKQYIEYMNEIGIKRFKPNPDFVSLTEMIDEELNEARLNSRDNFYEDFL